jgi:hypothetical protein
MQPIITDEFKNALRGCLEIPLYLRIGATRFSGTVAAFKRSMLVPVCLIPIIFLVIPKSEVYASKSFEWQASLMLIQILLGTAIFAGIIYFFKAKNVTNEDFLKCMTGYNWLSLSAFAVNIPLILLALLGINTWDDVFAMMILVTLYSYSFLAFMITHILRTNIFIGMAFAIADLMLGEIIRSITTYFMIHNF